MDTGGYNWPDHGLVVKINDGRGDANVFSIYLTSSQYATSEGIRVGSSLSEAQAAFPSGVREDAFDGDFSWKVPGLSLTFVNGQVVEVSVYPTDI
jgi:hypothetical protein